jgi:hypothetical protein
MNVVSLKIFLIFLFVISFVCSTFAADTLQELNSIKTRINTVQQENPSLPSVPVQKGNI